MEGKHNQTMAGEQGTTGGQGDAKNSRMIWSGCSSDVHSCFVFRNQVDPAEPCLNFIIFSPNSIISILIVLDVF